MTLLAIIILIIGLFVGWYIGRSYYDSDTKIFFLILLILVSFFASWLALKYGDNMLRETKPSSALWTGFIISSIIAFISLLNGTKGGCGREGCACKYGEACKMPSAKFTGNADNLKKIEGIGPAIEKHLNAHGIYTFEQLADTDPIHVRNILDRDGDRFQNHHPDTRPAQSAMARDGKREELTARQDQLDGGRVV